MSEDNMREDLKQETYKFVEEMNRISYDISEFISQTQKKYKMNADKSYIFFEFLRKYGEFSKENAEKDMKNPKSDMDMIIDNMFQASKFYVSKEEKKK